MSLAEDVESLAYELAFWIQGIEDADTPIDEMAKLAHEVSGNLRSLAIMLLLSKGKVDRFHHNLIRSARIRLAYLERVHREGAFEQHDFVASVCDPLFDAVAAGAIELAIQIADLSPTQPRPGHEYEDDHCYAQAMQLLIRGRSADAGVAPLLRRMEDFLGDPDDARIGLCRALTGTDQQAFDEAFLAFLETRTQQIEEAQVYELEEPPLLAQRAISIEALALLRLAQMRGFDSELEYQYCPSIARIPMRTPYPGD